MTVMLHLPLKASTTEQPFHMVFHLHHRHIRDGSFAMTATGLSCNAQYYYQSYASNYRRNRYKHGIRSFTTGACSPTLTVQSATSITSSGATLNGTLTSNNGASSTIEGFNYGTSLSYGSVASSTGTFGTEHLLPKRLRPLLQYRVRLPGFCCEPRRHGHKLKPDIHYGNMFVGQIFRLHRPVNLYDYQPEWRSQYH